MRDHGIGVEPFRFVTPLWAAGTSRMSTDWGHKEVIYENQYIFRPSRSPHDRRLSGRGAKRLRLFGPGAGQSALAGSVVSEFPRRTPRFLGPFAGRMRAGFEVRVASWPE